MYINFPQNWFDIRQGLQGISLPVLVCWSIHNEGSHCPPVPVLHEHVSTDAYEAPVIEGCL